jgi:hypothetical protein
MGFPNLRKNQLTRQTFNGYCFINFWVKDWLPLLQYSNNKPFVPKAGVRDGQNLLRQ